ncbi:hypothetical protein BYT27DRAFT_7195060 [Phlegmacium glaucopus]|nr:hypothetical protein BYT27DRAFT_7195060 [Phlegmacium glaucopus]
MADILKAYTALSASSPRSDATKVLNSVINAPPLTFDTSSRTELIKNILDDLKSCGTKGRLTLKDAGLALLAVKTLGKDPSGSEYLASSTNLSTLLGFADAFKDDPDASSETLRCVANAMLLIEEARTTFISKSVNGGDKCLAMLEKSSSPDQIFILSRALFLSTASGPSYIESVVDGKYHGRSIIEIIGSKLGLLTTSIRGGAPMAREAMTDLLKFSFNLCLHYPKLVESEPQNSEPKNDKVMGDFWNPKLDGLLPHFLRVFHDLPPTSPCPITSPLTHVIHALITVPVTPTLRPTWLGLQRKSSRSRNSASNSPKTQTSRSSESFPQSRSDSPARSDQSPTSLKPSTLDRALSVLAAGRRSLNRTPSLNNVTSYDVLQHAYDLLEVSFSHYFPGKTEPDDPEVRARCKAESSDTLEDMLSPLVVLITKLCIADEASRTRVRHWIVPEDLDRSSPLEERPDILGRCLRLLSCIYHPRLKDAIGELLFAVADSDASTLCSLVGYGNVAGFLFHKGFFSAPSQSRSGAATSTSSSEAINPITGTTMKPAEGVPMSDEEKELEVEKLFVLFDRLEKTGAIPADQNPMRKAIQQRRD